MKKVLVVDDDKDINSLLKMILEKSELTVTSAFNGKEAISLLQKEAYDAVFLDLLMPEMGGKEALEEIHKDPKIAKAIFIILTAKELSQEEQSALKSKGATGFCRKARHLMSDLEKTIKLIQEQ